METIDKSLIGVAGEFYVAAELCRRRVYAQPTFGNQKRLDLLAFGASGKMVRLEVKTKQGKEWPGCRGLHGADSFIVFVDFYGKSLEEKPDIFVLSSKEWRALAIAEGKKYVANHPGRSFHIQPDGCPVFRAKADSDKKDYHGLVVKRSHLLNRKSQNAWEKIETAINQPTNPKKKIQA